MGGIREVLGLETDAMELSVALISLTYEASIEEMTRIHLKTWLGGKDFEAYPCPGAGEPCLGT